MLRTTTATASPILSLLLNPYVRSPMKAIQNGTAIRNTMAPIETAAFTCTLNGSASRHRNNMPAMKRPIDAAPGAVTILECWKIGRANMITSAHPQVHDASRTPASIPRGQAKAHAHAGSGTLFAIFMSFVDADWPAVPSLHRRVALGLGPLQAMSPESFRQCTDRVCIPPNFVYDFISAKGY